MSSVRKGSDFTTTENEEGSLIERATDSDYFASTAYYKNKALSQQNIN